MTFKFNLDQGVDHRLTADVSGFVKARSEYSTDQVMQNQYLVNYVDKTDGPVYVWFLESDLVTR